VATAVPTLASSRSRRVLAATSLHLLRLRVLRRLAGAGMERGGSGCLGAGAVVALGPDDVRVSKVGAPTCATRSGISLKSELERRKLSDVMFSPVNTASSIPYSAGQIWCWRGWRWCALSSFGDLASRARGEVRSKVIWMQRRAGACVCCPQYAGRGTAEAGEAESQQGRRGDK
jgi:hypothetical protein